MLKEAKEMSVSVVVTERERSERMRRNFLFDAALTESYALFRETSQRKP